MHRKCLACILLAMAAFFARIPPGSCSELDAPTSPGDGKPAEMVLFTEIPSIFGASKFEQSLLEAPASVTLITASDIKKFGWRTLAEILQSVGGFFTTYDRNYNYIGVRGFNRPGDYNTRVLLLVDGHRINDAIFDTAAIGTEFPLDVDLIERVEVIRGPSSSLYGSNAFLGVVNVTTRSGKDVGGVELSSSVGSFDTYQGRTTAGKKFGNGLEVLVSGSYTHSMGQDLFFKEFDQHQNKNGVARDCDRDEFYSTFAKMSYKDFSLEGAYASREKGIPTGSFGTVFGDRDTRTTDARGYVDLKYDHRFTNGLGATGRLYYDYSRYNGDYIYDVAEAGERRRIVPMKDYGYGDWAGGEFQLDKRLFEKHYVIVGAEYRSFFRQDQGAFDVKPDFTYFDTRNQTYAWAVYAQDEFRIRDNLILNAGLRYDYYGTFGGTLNPRLALIYEPFKKTAVKLLYGTAFRAPNAFELYYGDQISSKATGLLEPETIDTYEIVLERYLTDQLRLSVSGYYYSIENLISQTRDPLDGLVFYQNLDNVTARGIELQLDGKLPWWDIETRASYAWQLTEDGETGKVISNSPKHQAKLNVAVPLYQDKLFAGTELRYMSPRKTLLAKDSDDVFTTNLTLFSKGFLKGLELSAGVYNLFDERHGDPGGEEHVQDLIQQDGRTFRVKLKYSF